MVTNQKIFVQIIQGVSSQSQGVMSPSCDEWLHKVWGSLQIPRVLSRLEQCHIYTSFLQEQDLHLKLHK